MITNSGLYITDSIDLKSLMYYFEQYFISEFIENGQRYIPRYPMSF